MLEKLVEVERRLSGVRINEKRLLEDRLNYLAAMDEEYGEDFPFNEVRVATGWSKQRLTNLRAEARKLRP